MDTEMVAKIATLIEQNKWIMGTMKEMKADIKSLNAWKLKMTGATIALGALFAFVFEAVRDWMIK